MSRISNRRTAYTLLELLMVVAIIAIVSAALIPSANSGVSEQLEAAARVLAADLDYAHTLAVTYESKYRTSFNTSAHTWTLTHSGTNAALSSLPASPFHAVQAPATQRTTQLRSLPGASVQLSIYAVLSQGSPTASVSDVEFGPLGSTTRTAETVVWLTAGAGSATRYVDVRVNPVTGLVTVGSFRSTAPALPPIGAAQALTGGP
jgi:prepilin-type N-terminal cleavage/methylation domain-containing protein